MSKDIQGIFVPSNIFDEMSMNILEIERLDVNVDSKCN